MDIESLKCSHELFQRRLKLEEEFKLLEKNRADFQKNCRHVRISFGFESPSAKLPLQKCLFCEMEDVDDSYPFINASTYQRRLHSTFGFSKRVERGFHNFQKLCIEALEENPFLEEEDLIERIEMEIRRDEEINEKDDRIHNKLYHL